MSQQSRDARRELYKTYAVQRAAGPMTMDADWNKAAWRDVEPVTIADHMGDEPEHRPKTQAKLLYDDANIYVIFRVEDRYVRAIAREHHGRVWEDSCVEFFFTPGADRSAGYMNLEMNCGNTLLFGVHTPDNKNGSVAPADCDRIEVARTLPEKITEPEITEPTVWAVEYRLPLDIIAKHFKVEQPAPGVVWRANLYKCADETSHPHWLTWSVVDLPKPSFHQPDYFGVLVFK